MSEQLQESMAAKVKRNSSEGKKMSWRSSDELNEVLGAMKVINMEEGLRSLLISKAQSKEKIVNLRGDDLEQIIDEFAETMSIKADQDANLSVGEMDNALCKKRAEEEISQLQAALSGKVGSKGLDFGDGDFDEDFDIAFDGIVEEEPIKN